jgi:hypothetical protein
VLALSLGGCLPDERIIAERNTKDNQKCLSYEAQPGTDAYVNCRAQLNSPRSDAQSVFMQIDQMLQIFRP